MSATLLIEYNELKYDQKLIAEASDPSKPLILSNVLLQNAETRNQNGRVYPREILMREMQSYKKNFVDQRRALGELDHPNDTVVNLKNACCNITTIWENNNEVRGNIQILTTPAGNIVRELIKNDIKLGVSSRGMGSQKQIGENTAEVEDDFYLISFDIVSNPSTTGAFINESVSTVKNSPYFKIENLIRDFLGELR